MSKIYIPRREDLIPDHIKNKMGKEGDSFYIENTEENKIEFQDFLPYGFRNTFKEIQIDLIPKTSWGASLSNALVKEDWDKIRKPFIEIHGNRCQLCGQKGKDISNTIRDVDTHEIWEYSKINDKEKVQTLKGFLALCSGCHLMFHLGFAQVNNKYDITVKRLQKLEKLTESQVDKKVEDIFKRWNKRSEFEWKIDITILKDYGINELRFKNSKHIEPSKFIF